MVCSNKLTFGIKNEQEDSEVNESKETSVRRTFITMHFQGNQNIRQDS